MTVISILDVRIRPDRLADAPAIVHETLTATRAFEGSLGVEVARDSDDETHWILHERWRALEDDDAYRAWRATPEGASPLGPILAEAPKLTRTIVDDDI
jgi:heme oxygenase (mycobilin-producing)